MSKGTKTFRSPGAVLTGTLTVVATIALAFFGAFYPGAGWPDWLIAAMVLVAVVSYVAQIRPAVVLGDAHLTLRNMLSTVDVPWAAVGQVDVRQIVTVEVGERVFDCPAVGRSPRQIRRDAALPADHHATEDSFGLFVEGQIRHRAADARAQQGIEEFSEEQAALAARVREVRAWPELVVLGGAIGALIVTIVA